MTVAHAKAFLSLSLAALLTAFATGSSAQSLGPLNPGSANASIAKMDHAGLPPPTVLPAPHEELLFTPIGVDRPLRMIASGEVTSGASRQGVFILLSELNLQEFGSGPKGASFFLFSQSFPPLLSSDVFMVPMPGNSPFVNSQIGATLPNFLGQGATMQLAAVSPLAKRIDGVPDFQSKKRLTQISFMTENSAAYGIPVRFGVMSSNPVNFDFLVNITAADGTKTAGVALTMASVINGKPVLSRVVLFNREAGHILPNTDSVTQEIVDIANWTATEKRTNTIIPLYKLINEL